MQPPGALHCPLDSAAVFVKRKDPTKAPLWRRIATAMGAAFTKLRTDHPDEHFYFFAIYTTEEASYLTATAASEESLASAMAKSAATGTEVSERDLRYSCADSPYHDLCELHEAGGRRTLEACFVALAALDREGVFGSGEERERMIVNVVYGDMSNERWLEQAELLNPKAAVESALPFLDLNRPSGDVKCWGAGVYQVTAVSCSLDRSVVAYSGSGGEVEVLRARERRPVSAMRRRRGAHWASVLSPDGNRVYLGDENAVLVMDARSGRTKRLFASAQQVRALAVSPDDRTLAVTAWDSPTIVYDIGSGKRLWQRPDAARGFAFSGDSTRVAFHSLAPTSEIVCADARSGASVWTARLSMEGTGECIHWHGPTDTIVAAVVTKRETTTLVWFDAVGRMLDQLAINAPVTRFAVSPDGDRIAYLDGRALVVIDRRGQELARGTGGQEQMIDCVFLDQERVVGVGRDVNEGPAILELSIAGT
jgi:hypothetical protein